MLIYMDVVRIIQDGVCLKDQKFKRVGEQVFENQVKVRLSEQFRVYLGVFGVIIFKVKKDKREEKGIICEFFYSLVKF